MFYRQKVDKGMNDWAAGGKFTVSCCSVKNRKTEKVQGESLIFKFESFQSGQQIYAVKLCKQKIQEIFCCVFSGAPFPFFPLFCLFADFFLVGNDPFLSFSTWSFLPL